MTPSSTPRSSRRPKRLGLMALLLIPLLLLLNAPVLAAVVPGALLAVASMQATQTEQHALPTAALVDPHDGHDMRRLAEAIPVAATTRRVG